MNRAKRMKGICHIWSRGRLISLSLPVGDDRYLNLSSQKRPTGRNLGRNRLVRRSGTASRGTALLIFWLRMRSFPGTEVLPYTWADTIDMDNLCYPSLEMNKTDMRRGKLSVWSQLNSKHCLWNLLLSVYSTMKQKFGFIKRVGKGEITTVKDLESWRFER